MVRLVNDAGTELLQFFCRFPTETFSISEIARETGLSKPWVAEKVAGFADAGLVTVAEKGNMKQVQFNRDSDAAIRVKRVVNLEAFYASGVLDEIVDAFSYPDAVVLFGSFARGEDVEGSDVDVAVLSHEDGDAGGDVLGRPVSVQVFAPDDLPRNMVESLANGIVLYGYLEVPR